MPTPQEQSKFNKELDKTQKFTENINKSMKEGNSLASAFQKSLKGVQDVMQKNVKLFKDLSSEAQGISDSFEDIESRVDKVKKSTESESKSTARVYKKRWALNKAFKEQVGIADKMASIERDGIGRQKMYQDASAFIREIYQDNADLTEFQLDKLQEMRDASRGLSDAQSSRVMSNAKLNILDKSILATNEDLFKSLQKQGGENSRGSQILQDQVDRFMDIRDLAQQTAVQYDEIGKSGFSMVDTSAQRAEIEREMEMITRRYFGVNKSIGDEKKEIYKSQLAALDATDRQNKLQDELDRKVKGASKFITGPFETLHGLLESMPMGSLIAPIIGVDRAMEDFVETTREGLVAAMDPNNVKTFDEAISEIGTSGMTAINGIVDGFTSLGKAVLANPMFAFVVAMVAAGTALSAMYDGILETRKELGVSFGNAAKLQSTINLTAMQFKLLGVTGEDVKGITDGIRQNLGGTTQPSADLVKGFTSLVATTGISGENVTKLATQMMAVGASSQEAAMSQIESVAALARANDVAPGDILNDIASDSDLFAGFAQDGGRNLAMAAITAKKLGLEMATVSKITDSLLNFEESVNAQMEAQMLTGRNINTDKARELALSGDLDGMQREITSQIGSQADFEAMNVVQRRALADAFGVSVGELGKMITNQDKINNMTEGEKKSRDMIAGILKFIGGSMASLLSLAKAMIPAFVGLGIAIAVAFYPVTLTIAGFVALGKLVEVINKHFEFGGVLLGSLVALATLFALKMKLAGTNIGGGLMKSLGGVKDKLKSAVSGGGGAAGAAKGGGVGQALAKGGKGMGAGLSGLAKGMGAFSNPKVMLGMAAITLQLIGMGFALKLAAPGIRAFGEAISSIVKSVVPAIKAIGFVMGIMIKSIAKGISTIIGAIGDFAVKLMTVASPTVALGLFATAAGFTALAGSMTLFAGAGLLALPALLALTAFNAVSGAGGGGEEDNKVEQLLTEQNQKLDMMNNQLKTIKSNTKRGADEAKGFSDLVTFA